MTYPDDLPARVLALVEGEGYSIRAAAARTGVAVTTAWQWVQQANRIEQGNKPILDRYQRRVVKALDLMDRGLDVIAEDQSNQLAYKSLHQLNFIAGTGTDKLQKNEEHSLRNQSNQAAHTLADAISRLASLDTSHLANLIEGEVLSPPPTTNVDDTGEMGLPPAPQE